LEIRKTIYNWLKTRHTLIIRNDENFEERRRIAYTPSQMILVSLGILILICGISFYAASRLFNRLTFRSEEALAVKILQLTNTLDSLSNAMNAKESYTENLKKVMGDNVRFGSGNSNIFRLDSIVLQQVQKLKDKAIQQKGMKIFSDSIDLNRLEPLETKLRQEFETQAQKSNLQLVAMNLGNVNLFAPVKGLITNRFNPNTMHYGIDIVAPKNAPIMAIDQGIVVISNWTEETGYVVVILHPSGLLSVYKHCSTLLKKIGNLVEAGEPIAIIGNTGELTNGPHLHFELWQRNNPLNPEPLISF
jgi:murein DD-endopeptidase MepM/ murein hydrolase activator NlpD